MTTPSDAIARSKALDITQSFLVQAPAGSGKTAALTARYLKTLSVVNEPEQVLAITFTRKAVGEMRARAMSALKDARSGRVATNEFERELFAAAHSVLKRDKDQDWGLASNPSRMRILTFDSLAHMLTRLSPISSRLGGAMSVSDRPGDLYLEAVDSFFGILDSPESTEYPHVVSFMRHLDNHQAKARRLLTTLLASRDQWLTYLMSDESELLEFINATVTNLVEQSLLTANQQLLGHKSALMTLWQFAASNLDEVAEFPLSQYESFPDATVDNFGFYKALADWLTTASGDLRCRVTKNEGFPAATGTKEEKAAAKAVKAQMMEVLSALKSEGADAIMDLVSLPSPDLSENGSALDLLKDLSIILPILTSHLLLIFSRHNESDHTHIFLSALAAMSDENDAVSELSLMMDYNISHLLVDEFQDTSLPQIRLIEKLVEGWTLDDGRTLFAVGDPMQSIYSFRDANVSNYLAAQKFGIGQLNLESIKFTENFRSQDGIVEWNNNTFAGAFPSCDSLATGAVKFSRSTAYHPHLEGDAVNVKVFAGVNSKSAEATHLATCINSIRKRDAQESIAILVRSRSALTQIIPALKSAGISYVASDIDGLSSIGAVNDLHMIARAITNLGDRLAWCSLLRSPMLGIELNELHCLAGDTKNTLIWDNIREANNDVFSTSSSAALARFRKVMALALRNFQRKPLRGLVEGVWIELGGPACARADDLDAAGQYLNLLSESESGGELISLSALEEAMSRLYAKIRRLDSSAVQIMTMHKAKGLEFDHVFLPVLDAVTGQDDKRLLNLNGWINESGEGQLALCPMPPIGRDKAPLYEFLTKERSKKVALENTRLLYVAATRAVKRLYLSFSGTMKDGLLVKPSAQTLISRIWDSCALEEVRNNISEHLITDDSSADDNLSQSKVVFSRLTAKWRAPLLIHDKTLQNHRGAVGSLGGDEMPVLDWESKEQRAIGVVLHRILQDLADKENLIFGSAEVEEYSSIWKQMLRVNGVTMEHLNNACAVLKHCVLTMLADESGEWILNGNHDFSACEFSMMTMGEHGLEELIVDRMVVNKGQRFIFDYKSSSPAPGESIEDFEQRELAHYREKMLQYKRVSDEMHKDHARMFLYFPMIGKSSEYTTPIAAGSAISGG